MVEREEAGTPNILGNIRAGLAFQIQRYIGADNIMRIEKEILAEYIRALHDHPNIVILGPPLDVTTVERVPIVSFLIKAGKRFLHHNFVTSVLNDIYGIQSRSGCMCAGPYSTRLLGLTKAETTYLFNHMHDREYLKPGFCRMSLVYFNAREVNRYITDS